MEMRFVIKGYRGKKSFIPPKKGFLVPFDYETAGMLKLGRVDKKIGS